MTVNFVCPNCKQRLAFPSEIAGRSIQCPRCLNDLTPLSDSHARSGENDTTSNATKAKRATKTPIEPVKTSDPQSPADLASEPAMIEARPAQVDPGNLPCEPRLPSSNDRSQDARFRTATSLDSQLDRRAYGMRWLVVAVFCIVLLSVLVSTFAIVLPSREVSTDDKSTELALSEEVRKRVPPGSPDTYPKAAEPDKALVPIALAPINLSNLQTSDRLTITVPSKKKEEPVPQVWKGHTNHIRGVSFTSDGKFVVSVSGDVYHVGRKGLERAPDYSIRVWDARRGKVLHEVDHFIEPLDSLAISPGGRFATFAYGGRWIDGEFVNPKSGDVRMYDILAKREIPFASDPEGKLIPGKVETPRFVGLSGSVFSTTFSKDMQLVAGVSNKGSVCVWNTKTAEVLLEHGLSFPRDWPRGSHQVVFTPDGKYVILDTGNLLSIVDAKTGREHETLAGHNDLIASVAIGRAKERFLILASAGGGRQEDGRFVPGARDYAIRAWFWEPELPAIELKPMSGHTAPVLALQFRPGTMQLLSTGMDGTLRLWDVPRGRLLCEFRGHTELVRSLSISSDGRYAVSGGDDCSIRYWQLPATVSDLIEALALADPVAIEKNINEMDAMGWQVTSAFQPLVRALDNRKIPSKLVRNGLRTFHSLREKKYTGEFLPEHASALLRLLKEADEISLFSLGADGLIRLGKSPASKELSHVHEGVAELLDTERNADRLTLLIQILESLDVKGTKVSRAIKELVAHDDRNVRNSAIHAILKIAPDEFALGELIVLVDRVDVSMRESLIEKLKGKLSEFEGLDVGLIRSGLKSKVSGVRFQLLLELNKNKSMVEGMVGDVVLLLKDDDDKVCALAMETLRKHELSPKEAVPLLANLIQTDRSVSLASQAAIFLAKIDPTQDVLVRRGISRVLKHLESDADVHAINNRPDDYPAIRFLSGFGDEVVVQVIDNYLRPYSPKDPGNRALEPTRWRMLGYVLLRELAKGAAGNIALKGALISQENKLSDFWVPREKELAATVRRFSIDMVLRDQCSQTARVAQEAYFAIVRLRGS